MSALKGRSRWNSGIDFENNSRQCRWQENVQRIFHRANEERKDKSENENRVCWSKNCIWSLWDVNSEAAVFHALRWRVAISNSLFNVSSVHPATLSVITRRKRLSHYENPGSGKRVSVIIQPGLSWWRIRARTGRAFVFWISAFFSCLLCDGECFA